MARKRTITDVTDVTLPDESSGEQEKPAEVPLEETDIELKTFIEAFPATARVRIFRYDRHGNMVFAGSTNPGNCTEEWLQETYGEGKYYLKLFNDKGINIKSRTVFIGPDETGLNMPLTSPVQPAALPGIDPIQIQIESLRSELHSQRDQTDRLLELLINRAEPAEKTSMKELVDAMASVKEMISTKETPTSVLESMVSFLKQGIEIGSSGSVDGGWKGIVSDAIKMIPEVTKQVTGTDAQPEGKQVITPKDFLMHGIRYLKGRMRVGHDPEYWANFILSNLDEPQWEPFLQLLNEPYEKIGEIDPELLTPVYRPFFESLFNGLKQGLSEKDDIVRPVGDGGDAATDEGAGEGSSPPPGDTPTGG